MDIGQAWRRVLDQAIYQHTGTPPAPTNFASVYSKGPHDHQGITPEGARYKLGKVKPVATGPKKVSFLVTHDDRTIRYPDSLIKVNDSIQLDIITFKIMDFIKFESGMLCIITGGSIVYRDRHPGSFDIVHIKDLTGHTSATRLNNVFIIGNGAKAYISLQRG